MRRFLNLFVLPALTFPLTPAAFACTVCFGDPNSNMSKAALAGVFFLGGVITFVLGWIGVTIFVWTRRAKKIYGSIES